jgi:hypothetical protein
MDKLTQLTRFRISKKKIGRFWKPDISRIRIVQISFLKLTVAQLATNSLQVHFRIYRSALLERMFTQTHPVSILLQGFSNSVILSVNSFLPSPLPSALQLRVSFGLLDNQAPFLSILHLFRRWGVELWSEEVRRVWMEEVVAHLFFCSLIFHPSEADYMVSEQFSFYGVRLLASFPTPSLEDRGIPLRLAPTPWPVRHGWPYQ